MTTDHFRYDLLTQDALRSIVRRVLAEVAEDGLPGEHHFYISFRTDHPDAEVSERLRTKYPEEMTVVLQYQFWDMKVSDDAFEVGLSFNGVPENLYVPFEAMTGFFDPSVQFGLRFESVEEPGNENAANEDGDEEEPFLGALAADQDAEPIKKKNAKKAAKTKEDGDEPSPDGDGGGQVVSLDKFRKKK